MKFFSIIFTLLLWLNPLMAESDTNLTTDEERLILEAQKIWKSINQQKGEIKLQNGVATLNIPEEFYYLNPKDAETILVDVWGNPPTGAKTLGMIFPAGSTPFDKNTWGMTIEYEEDGYVSDEDADDIDYDDLLSDMQDAIESANKMRVKAGYESIELVGWASQPHYDKDTHKLYWAKEIAFGNEEAHTLNYNIRILGRKGVLILNFIAGIDQLDEIDSQLNTVLSMANFNEGLQYDDFDPDIDKVAAYGIGALIAGKVAAKFGLIAGLLIFLKKFWILLLLGVGFIGKKLFK